MDTHLDIEKRIIDLVIEQSEIFDAKNIKLEEKTISKMDRIYSSMQDKLLRTVEIHGTIDTHMKYQNLMNRLQSIVEEYYSLAYKVLVTDVIDDYMSTGYENMSSLIDTGIDAEESITKAGITELKKRIIPDPNAIEFMKTHAFEQVKGFSNDILEKLRSSISNEMLLTKGNKLNIYKNVYNILDVSSSRAETIVQTELSMAYNNGALERMREFNNISDRTMLKYWHGFKYSESTCTYCRPRIGLRYPVDSTLEVLPAHPRCRCVWLPFVDGWEKPISTIFTRNANMINRAYSPDEIYNKLNIRLGIDYASYLNVDDAARYLSGERNSTFYNDLAKARDKAIKDKSVSFDIASKLSDESMKIEYTVQMQFWKKYVAEGLVDNDVEQLGKAYEAIRGIMVLPWTGKQLSNFDRLLSIIEGHIK